MYYPAAFDAESRKIGKTILLNHVGRGLSTQLRSLGYQVTEVDLSEFLKAGGAAKCRVLRLSEMGVAHRG